MCLVCPVWLSFILYNPVRKLLTNREAILDEAGIKADSVVLEVGAGNGFLTEILIEHAGRVISVEIQDGMIRKLKKRLADRPGRIEIVRGDISSVTQRENEADVCLLYYSFHEVSDKAGAVSNIYMMLKRGGIVAIYEPSLEVGRKAMNATVAMFKEAGLTPEISRDRLFTRFARLRKNA